MSSLIGVAEVVRKKTGWYLLAVALASCSQVVYQPAPVVPTKSPLSYSTKVKLTHVEAYIVEPGSTMIPDSRIENHVTDISTSPGLPRKEWEKSVADYLAARKTFTYLSTDSQTDLDLAMRLNIYIDPGTMQPLPRTGPPTRVRQSYELRKFNGVWKIVDGTRENLGEVSP